MIELQPPHRWAAPRDAGAMAELVNIAGEGLPLYLWESMAQAGETAWDVGRSRARRESGAFCYRNTVLREQDGNVAASLVGYPLDDDPAPVDYDDMPAMFVPLQQLEDLAPGTWYVNVLATYPKYRGMGFGKQLLAIAEQLCADTNRRGLSIIVSDANVGARSLYERLKYVERARRPIVKEGWRNPGNSWVLLIKEI